MLKSINTLQIERTMIRMEMKTEILPASDEKSIEKAAALLQHGGETLLLTHNGTEVHLTIDGQNADGLLLQ